MFKIIIVLIATLAVIKADDLSQGGEGTNVELQNGYSLNTLIDSSGKPAGAVYAYVGGKVSQTPQYPPYYPNTDLSQGTTALWLNQFAAASYFVAGVAAALSLWYICGVAFTGSKKSIETLEDDVVKSSDKEPAEKEKEKVKSRKRRAIHKADAEMNRLASIVLSAVESGECFEKSICLLGSQISDKKGKLADTLLTNFLPVTVQRSDYYIILKKSLRGEISCEKFGCTH